MTKQYIKQIKNKIEKLADEIDIQLEQLEQSNKDNTKTYEELFYISSGLRELSEVEF